jgi:hypothetical protein
MDAHATHVWVEERLCAIDNKIKLLKRHLNTIEDMVTEIRVVVARTQPLATPMPAAATPTMPAAATPMPATATPMMPTAVPSTPIAPVASESSGTRCLATVEGVATGDAANDAIGAVEAGLSDDVGGGKADEVK